MPKQLFVAGDAPQVALSINTGYAKQFEEKKRREELNRLEEKYKNINTDDDGTSTDSESDEEEDEDGELLTPSIDVQILKTLAAIRAKNEQVYDPNVKFFNEAELAQAERECKEKNKTSSKPMSVKEYQREMLLKEGQREEAQEDLTFEQQQVNLKEEFMATFVETTLDGDDDSGSDFLRVRQKTEEEIKREDEEYKTFLLENLAKSKDARESMVDWLNYRQNPKVSEEDAFLMDYVLGRGWIEKEHKRVPSYDRVLQEEDDLAVEAADDFEACLNFRFEQPGADKIQTFPRHIEPSIRREDTKRKDVRKARKERKEAEKRQETEELKRLKNLKKAELCEKLHRLQQVSGKKDIPEELFADGDFDLAEHDARMAGIFNDEYFAAAEDGKKPEFTDSEDEPSTQSRAVKKATKVVKKTLKRKHPPSALDELYKLDYEDKIDGIACRFKYHPVQSTSFGLDPVDLLTADDADLNAHVSLKKLAPFRPPDKQQADIKKYSDKRRVYQFHARLRQNKQSSRKQRHTE